MSGGVRGTVLLRGRCLVCDRDIPGGNCESGLARGSAIMLRNHVNPATGKRCAGSRDRVPTDHELTAAWGLAKREAAARRDKAWRDRYHVHTGSQS
jgi:hypothetical protein